jgi:hypothetical protein
MSGHSAAAQRGLPAGHRHLIGRRGCGGTIE